MEALFRRLLAGIPHDWHRRNDIARYEGYWSSVFYAFFQAVMDGVAVEEATSRGRLDLAVRLGTDVYLFEFKVAARSTAGAALAHHSSPDGSAWCPTNPPGLRAVLRRRLLAQLQARGYADRHRSPGIAVHLIGVEISAESRDVVAFEAVTCSGDPGERSPGA